MGFRLGSLGFGRRVWSSSVDVGSVEVFPASGSIPVQVVPLSGFSGQGCLFGGGEGL